MVFFIKPISRQAQKCSSCHLGESSESASSLWSHHRSRPASREGTGHMWPGNPPTADYTTPMCYSLTLRTGQPTALLATINHTKTFYIFHFALRLFVCLAASVRWGMYSWHF